MTNVGMTENIIDNKPNAVIYLRVSSKKQFDEGYSIASQKSSCDNYARLKKFNVSKIFTDEGVSATIFLWNRPKGRAMKEYIEKNNIKHIIVVKMDRLFRNVRDLLETVDELTSKDIGLPWHWQVQQSILLIFLRRVNQDLQKAVRSEIFGGNPNLIKI